MTNDPKKKKVFVNIATNFFFFFFFAVCHINNFQPEELQGLNWHDNERLRAKLTQMKNYELN